MIIGWIILSLLVGALGSDRKIGFAGAFFLSLFLSPIIGLIIVLCSKDKKDEEYKEKLLSTQEKTQETLSKIQSDGKSVSISTELHKLMKMRDKGLLDEEEFQKAKAKLLSD